MINTTGREHDGQRFGLMADMYLRGWPPETFRRADLASSEYVVMVAASYGFSPEAVRRDIERHGLREIAEILLCMIRHENSFVTMH